MSVQEDDSLPDYKDTDKRKAAWHKVAQRKGSIWTDRNVISREINSVIQYTQHFKKVDKVLILDANGLNIDTNNDLSVL